MTEPNPTIDLAKARADWDAIDRFPQGVIYDVKQCQWFRTYAEPLLAALEQMQAEMVAVVTDASLASAMRDMLEHFDERGYHVARIDLPLGLQVERVKKARSLIAAMGV